MVGLDQIVLEDGGGVAKDEVDGAVDVVVSKELVVGIGVDRRARELDRELRRRAIEEKP